MAEVGVLNLQIHDNSAKAAEGIGRLASTLERVRKAVGSGIKLGSIAGQLDKINKAVSEAASTDTISKLNQLADSLSRLKEVGDISIRMSGVRNAMKSLENSESIQSIGKQVQDSIESAFENVEPRTDKIEHALEKCVGDAASEAIRRVGNAGFGSGFFKQFNPLTGMFEDLEGVTNMAEWNAYWDKSSAAAEQLSDSVQNAESTMEQFHELVVNTSWEAGGMAEKFAQIFEMWSSMRSSRALPESTIDRTDYQWMQDGAIPGEGTVGDAPLRLEGAVEGMQNLSESMRDVQNASDETTGKLKDLDRELKEKKKDTNDTRSAFDDLRDGIRNMMSPVSQLSNEFWRMARRMAMRAIIKELAKGFKEGIENLYWYSKAVGTDFAPAMDSAASSMLQLRNSIGAAVAPAIQALIPVLQTVVNWIITAVNYMNQFLALISGRSGWTKALPVAADAFEDTSKKAKNAGKSAKDVAKEVKELLADWDELNIIQSETGGAGGTGSSGSGTSGKIAADYKSMFEEIAGFDREVKAFVDNLKNQFGSILDFVKRIGAAVLAWRVSQAFTGIIGALAGFVATGALIDLVFNVVQVFDKTYLQTGNIGWLIGDTLATIVGAALAQRALRGVLGAGMARIAIPLTLAFSAAASIKANIENTDASALSQESIALSILSGGKGGAAVGWLYYLGGAGLATSVAAGAAASVIWFGASIGIKAIKDTIDVGEITMDTVMADIASALATGLGVAGLELALGGTTLAAATLGTGALVLTLGALIGIQAIIAAQPENVAWGDYDATADEIKAFVEGEVFTVSASTTLKLINPKIEAVTQAEQALTAAVDEVTLTVNKIKLGYNDETVLKELQTQIFGEAGDGSGGLMKQFKDTVEAKKTLIETGIEILFSNGVNDDGTAKAMIDENNESWKALTKHMEDLGTRLSTSLKDAYNTSLTESARQMAVKSVEELTGMIAKVTYAMTQGEAWAKAQINLKDNLESLSSGAMQKTLDYIEQYKQEVAEATKTAYDAVVSEKAGLMAAMKTSMENALQLAGGNTEDENYKYYKAAYERAKADYIAWRDGRDAAVKDAMANAVDSETMEMIRETILGKLKGKAGESDVFVAFDEAIRNVLKESIDNGETEMTAELVRGMFEKMIDSYFGSDAGILKQMISMGLLDYGDLISEEAVAKLKDQMFLDKDAGELWDELIKNLFTPPNGGSTPDVIEEETFSNVTDAIIDVMEDADWQHMTDDEFRKFITSLKDSFGEESVNKALEGFDIPLSDLKIEPPNIDPVTETMSEAATAVDGYVNDIKNSMSELDGLSFNANFNVTYGKNSINGYATGGVVRAADMFMANENGNIEMMGKMGNSTVVANNQQIVEGISRGVAASNGGMAADMSRMVSLMQQFLKKEMTARVVPSASMGRSNRQSSEAYDRVTG